MDLLLKLLLLPLAHAIFVFARQRIRQRVKKDMVVGVRFGDAVLNRTIYIKLEKSVIVLNYEARTYVEVSLNDIYLSDPKMPTDVSGDLQELC